MLIKKCVNFYKSKCSKKSKYSYKLRIFNIVGVILLNSKFQNFYRILDRKRSWAKNDFLDRVLFEKALYFT